MKQHFLKSLAKLNHMYSDINLHKKLYLLFGITIIIQILFSILLNTIFVKNIFSKDYIASTTNTLQYIKDTMQSGITSTEFLSQNIIYNEYIYDILIENAENTDSIENYNYQKEINILLKNLSYPQTYVESITIYNMNNHAYTMDVHSGNLISRINPNDFNESASAKWYNIDNNIFMYRTIYNKNTFEQIGCMFILIKSDFLKNCIKSSSNSQTIQLLTENSEVVFSYPENSTIVSEDNFNNIIKSKNGSFIDNKRKSLVCFVSLKDLNWSIIFDTSLDTLYKNIYIVRNLIILSGGLSCIFISVLILLFSKNILTPVNILSQTIKNFKKNDVLSEIPVTRKDEFGELMYQYNTLVEHINILVNKIYMEKLTRSKAQLKVLQSQINPHFIFNTLETINWMSQLEGCSNTSTAINHLASLMKINAGKVSKFISLKEEIKYENDYCQIIKMRFPDNTEFKFDIDPKTKDLLVPTLLLQPLIENSINHGINKIDRKGIIIIRSQINQEHLILEVIDNGIGFDKKELTDINNKLILSATTPFEDNITSKEHHTGIANTNLRIKLVFGDLYGLSISSSQHHYCKVTCTLPIKKEEDTNV